MCYKMDMRISKISTNPIPDHEHTNLCTYHTVFNRRFVYGINRRVCVWGVGGPRSEILQVNP